MSEAARINSPEVTVSELSASLKRTLEDAYGFVRVRGELGNVKYHSSGHVYLDLKDDRACISGVIWRTTAARIKTKLEAGLEVVVTGRITTYAGRSQYQLVIDTLAPAGLGALMALLEERKRKLTAEGLFEASRKQLLPFLPHVIGVVTSPTGAVIRDILHRLEDRFPRHVVVWPVRVQGEGAAEQVAAAIRGFNALAPGGRIAVPSVIIVARGGGSLEDLWAFNEDIVVRAAADSLIPLISAVGHETDVTLIDFAADKRAPTPTAAAEMAVPVRADLLAQVDGIARRSRACWTRGQERRRTELRSAARALPTPDRLLAEPRQRCDLAGAGLLRGLRVNAQAHRAALARLETRLAPQAPGARLARVGDRVRAFEDRARRAQAVTLRRKTDALANVAGRLAAAMRANRAAHAALVARRREALAALAARSERAFSALIDARYGSLERLADLLAAFSYHGVLARGFALVRDADGAPVRSAVAVAPGNPIDIEFADGRLPAIATGGAVSAAAPAPVRRRPRRRAEAAAGQGNLFDGSI